VYAVRLPLRLEQGKAFGIEITPSTPEEVSATLKEELPVIPFDCRARPGVAAIPGVVEQPARGAWLGATAVGGAQPWRLACRRQRSMWCGLSSRVRRSLPKRRASRWNWPMRW